jgi:hypothetical protein
MLERDYQPKLIKKLERMFPGCVILKNDARYLQGIPDLVIFYEARYAFLEVKASKDSPPQPNQPYYVELLDSMSFAAFIYPENEREVLGALRTALQGFPVPPSA